MGPEPWHCPQPGLLHHWWEESAHIGIGLSWWFSDPVLSHPAPHQWPLHTEHSEVAHPETFPFLRQIWDQRTYDEVDTCQPVTSKTAILDWKAFLFLWQLYWDNSRIIKPTPLKYTVQVVFIVHRAVQPSSLRNFRIFLSPQKETLCLLAVIPHFSPSPNSWQPLICGFASSGRFI